jgi:hypothetical protein
MLCCVHNIILLIIITMIIQQQLRWFLLALPLFIDPNLFPLLLLLLLTLLTDNLTLPLLFNIF